MIRNNLGALLDALDRAAAERDALETELGHARRDMAYYWTELSRLRAGIEDALSRGGMTDARVKELEKLLQQEDR